MSISIRSNRVLIADRFVKAVIRMEGERITKIDDYESSFDEDYGDLIISPGFYDIHTHGYLGYDANHPGDDHILKWADKISEEGVCGFLPTTYTASIEDTKRAIAQISEQIEHQHSGAKILGIHMEGPFISEEFCGAQNRDFILVPTVSCFDELAGNNIANILNVTIAPEKDHDCELISNLHKKGIGVSLGHSGADINKTKQALLNGANGFTHVYNGMRKFSHHSEGVLDEALLGDAYGEIITDLKHVSKSALNLYFRCKRKDRVILVSDSLSIKGLPYETEFEFGNHKVYAKEDGGCYIKGTDTLAGSTLRINKAVRNVIEVCGVKIEDALAMCSRNPMEYLGIGDRGKIAEGYIADLVIIDDDINVAATYCEGKRTFRKGE